MAERLGLCHNTAVELSNQCEEAGLIRRNPGAMTAGVCCWKMTLKSELLLDSPSIDHAGEAERTRSGAYSNPDPIGVGHEQAGEARQ
jgi:hypothetical protein